MICFSMRIIGVQACAIYISVKNIHYSNKSKYKLGENGDSDFQKIFYKIFKNAFQKFKNSKFQKIYINFELVYHKNLFSFILVLFKKKKKKEEEETTRKSIGKIPYIQLYFQNT